MKKKTNRDIFRLMFVQTVGEQRADEMMADFQSRFLVGAAKGKLEEEVSEEFYQEAVEHISKEMPHFLSFLLQFELSHKISFKQA
jgi:ferritin-like protein